MSVIGGSFMMTFQNPKRPIVRLAISFLLLESRLQPECMTRNFWPSFLQSLPRTRILPIKMLFLCSKLYPGISERAAIRAVISRIL